MLNFAARIGVLFAFLLPGFLSFGQVINRFDFNSTATIMTATVGSDGTSVSPAAVAPNGIAYITTGCGGGVGMDMVVPGEQFDVDNISIEARFRRGTGEGTGRFFVRDPFYFGFNGGNLSARYTVVDSLGNTQTFQRQTAQTVLLGQYADYGFSYDKCTGVAVFTRNGVVVRTFDGPDDRGLYFNSVDAVIGSELDNACSAYPGYDWVEISGGSVVCAPLPVELVDFSGVETPAGIRLSWATATETNNAGFILQRSATGADYEDIAEVEGAGTTQEVSSYAYLDGGAEEGTNWYRLLQVDLDGNETVVATLLLEFSGLEAEVSAWPNPVADWLKVGLPAGETRIRMCNLQGKVVLEKAVEAEEYQTLELDMSGLESGSYVLLVQGGQGLFRLKVLIAR